MKVNSKLHKNNVSGSLTRNYVEIDYSIELIIRV